MDKQGLRFSLRELIILLFFLHISRFAQGSTLIINSMHSDPAAKQALNSALEMFKKVNPGIKVTVNTTDHESFKVQIRTWLPSNPPDVVSWFAGNRARFFVGKGLIEPIDDIWASVRSEFSTAAERVICYDGHAYLLPVTYYNWGFYYRRDLFLRAGIQSPPLVWSDFLDAVKRLGKAGILPVTLGTRNGWPAAAWFDYLALRLYGFSFYQDLISGKISFLDDKVYRIFKYWSDLIEIGAFPDHAPALSWQEASGLLWRGKAAMYLMGNFIAGEIPPDLSDKIDFFPFPKMSDTETVELAPTDVYFIPAKARNKENAKKFLTFLASKDIQNILNGTSKLLSPNLKTLMNEQDRFQILGSSLLKNATHLTQFFDRETHPEIATLGMDGFVEFMAFPDRIDRVLSRIEKARLRIYH